MTISNTITGILKSDSNVKTKLSAVANDLVQAITLDDNGSMLNQVNRLTVGLSAANAKMCHLFFAEMMAYKWDDSKKTFGKKNKGQVVRAKANAQKHIDSGLTIFDWYKDNVKVETKPKGKEFYMKRLAQDVAKSMELGADSQELLQIIESAGLDVVSLLDSIQEAA